MQNSVPSCRTFFPDNTLSSDARQQEFCAIVCCIALVLGFFLSVIVAALLLTGTSDEDNKSTRLILPASGLESEDPANPVRPTIRTTGPVQPTFRNTSQVQPTVHTSHWTFLPATTMQHETTTVEHLITNPTMATVSIASATQARPSSTLPTTVEVITTTGLPKHSAQMPATPLLCTVSSRFTAHSVIPEDGLCDYLFFESLYDEEQIGVYEPYTAGFEHFLQEGREMRRTTLGVSFSPLNDTVFTEVETPSFFGAIDRMWDRGVSHFGALSVQGAYAATPIYKGLLKLLQKLYHHVLQRVTPLRPCYTVLASFCRLRMGCHPYALQDSRDIFQPSLFIAMSHITIEGERKIGSRIWPLSTGDSPHNESYRQFGLTPNLVSSNSNLLYQVLHNVTRGAASLTMRCRTYKPKVVTTMDEEEYSLYQPCEERAYVFDVPPALLCSSGFVPTIYKKEFASVYTYNPIVNITFVYESVLTIAKKLCRFWLFMDIEVYGIAVYDVEYDAEPASCPQFNLTGGAFSRLELIKSINNFYRRFGVIPKKDHHKCLALANL